jgi:hypothetical protein
MPLTYDIDTAGSHVQVTGTGDIPMSALIDVVEQINVDPRFRSHFTVLFDLRAAQYTAELTDGDAFATAMRRRKDAFRGRFAVVVPPSLHFLGTLYCVLAKTAGFDLMACFKVLDDALRWCRAGRQPNG